MRDNTGRHQYFKFLHVPDRTHIEIHVGYKPEHSQGCVCMTVDGIDDMMEVYNDESAIYEVEIKDYEPA